MFGSGTGDIEFSDVPIDVHPFNTFTDYTSLKRLMNQKDLSGRLLRWAIKFQGYNICIDHRKGSQNIVADASPQVHEVETDISPIEIENVPEIELVSPPYLEVGSYLFRITIRFGICALSTSICPSRDCFLIDFVCIGVPEKLESDKATQFKSH